MGLAARLRRAWKSLFSDASVMSSAAGLLPGIFPYGQLPRRGSKELMQAYKRLPWLRTVSHRIAYDVAAVPWKLYRAKTQVKSKAFRGAQGPARLKLMADQHAAGELQEIESHPVLDLIADMNPALGGFSARLAIQLWLDIKGETFLLLERDGSGQPIEVWPVPSHWILETPSSGRPFYRANYQAWLKVIPEDDVLWLRSPDPENPYGRGTGIAEALADELDIDEFAAKTVKAWFYNRALPEAFVGIEGAGDDEVKAFAAKLDQEYRGVEKFGRPHVTNGKVTVELLQHSFKDQKLPELRQLQRDTIVQVFNIPPEILGIIENSNRATIEAAEFLYMKNVVCPRLDFLADGLQPLADEWDEGLVLGYVSPVPEDRDFKQRVMVAVPAVFTIDEHRALAGLPPLPNGEGEQLYEPASPLGFGQAPGEEREPEEPEDDEDLDEDEDEKAAKASKSVQSVIFSKEDGEWTLEKARDWLAKHGFKSGKVDETSQSWRFRQFPPSECESGSYSTLTENLPAGISMVACKRKGKSDGG